MIAIKSSRKSDFFTMRRVNTSENGTYIAPAFGTEYFLSNNFSIGGEFQGYSSSTTGTVKDLNDEEGDKIKEETSSSSSSLLSQILFRWYF